MTRPNAKRVQQVSKNGRRHAVSITRSVAPTPLPSTTFLPSTLASQGSRRRSRRGRLVHSAEAGLYMRIFLYSSKLTLPSLSLSAKDIISLHFAAEMWGSCAGADAERGRRGDRARGQRVCRPAGRRRVECSGGGVAAPWL